MTEKGAAHPISKKDLERHLAKVDEKLESINRGTTERENLFTLVKEIGSTNKNIMAREVQDTMEVLRKGFSLFYEMYALVEQNVEKLDSGITKEEKISFLGAYSMFAASSMISHNLDLMLGEQEPIPFDKKGLEFDFSRLKDDVLNMVLAKYYGIVNYSKRNNILEKGLDLPSGSISFFRHLSESALAKKSSFKKELVELVEKTEFRVADEFTISGFESTHHEKEKQDRKS